MTPVSFAHGRTVIQFGALLHEYIRKLTSGVAAVIIVDPDRKSIQLHRPSRPMLRLVDTDTLDDVLPGFHCGVVEVFE